MLQIKKHLRRIRHACIFAALELFFQSMQSNELYYHKTRAICKIECVPEFWGETQLDFMKMKALHKDVLNQGENMQHII